MKRRKIEIKADEAFRQWIQQQPSCISGRFSEHVHGEGRNPACHVRRAGKSGIAFKGVLACVPLTQDEHLTQHQHGEAACLERHLGGKWSVEDSKAWFDRQAARYRKEWESCSAEHA
jgi:hypothetical protein